MSNNLDINKIADNADIIIAGYAYTISGEQVFVLNLNNPKEACTLSIDGEMLSSNMNDVTINLVQAYYLKNKQFMVDDNA